MSDPRGEILAEGHRLLAAWRGLSGWQRWRLRRIAPDFYVAAKNVAAYTSMMERGRSVEPTIPEQWRIRRSR